MLIKMGKYFSMKPPDESEPRWEYKLIQVHVGAGAMQEILLAWGVDGWEVVNMHVKGTYREAWMRREISRNSLHYRVDSYYNGVHENRTRGISR